MYIKLYLHWLILCSFFIFSYNSNAALQKEQEKTFSYIACGTFEYNGDKNFRMQNAGVLNVLKKKAQGGKFSYTFFSNTNVMVGDQQAAAEAKSPPLVVLRDPANKRLTGGLKCLENFGIVGNAALKQVKHPIIADGQSRRFELSMNTTGYYPSQPAYNISYKKLNSKTLGKCILVTATSDFFTCRVPDSNLYMSGVFNIVMICDPTLETMYYRASGFEARLGSEQVNVKDSYWITLDGEAPAKLDDIQPQLNQALASIYLPGRGKLLSNTNVPPWSVHALAVRKYMDVTAGAVIEGKPNFAIMATVAGVLLIASAVSFASEILAEVAGTPVYEGIPSYIGQAGGWGSAQIYSAATGEKVDTSKWQSYGGDISDIVFLFVNVGKGGLKVAGKMGKWGYRLLKKMPYALKFGRHALSWKKFNKLNKFFQVKTVLSKIHKAYQAWFGKSSLSGKYQPPSSGQSGLVGSKYGPSPPGGLTFEGDAIPLKIYSAEYSKITNTLILNKQLIYQSPVPATELIALANAIAVDSRFGFSLAGKINGGYNKPDTIYHNMKKCDQFFGNIVYGRTTELPAGYQTVNNYIPVQAVNFPNGQLCVNFNFIYKFKQTDNKLIRKSTMMQINMLSAKKSKTNPGTWKFRKQQPKVPAAFKQNAMHLIDNLENYATMPAIKNCFDYGEIAAIFRTLKANNINLSKLFKPSL